MVSLLFVTSEIRVSDLIGCTPSLTASTNIYNLFCQFKTKGGSQLKMYCLHLTKEDCRRQNGSFIACDKVHIQASSTLF